MEKNVLDKEIREAALVPSTFLLEIIRVAAFKSTAGLSKQTLKPPVPQKGETKQRKVKVRPSK